MYQHRKTQKSLNNQTKMALSVKCSALPHSPYWLHILYKGKHGLCAGRSNHIVLLDTFTNNQDKLEAYRRTIWSNTLTRKEHFLHHHEYHGVQRMSNFILDLCSRKIGTMLFLKPRLPIIFVFSNHTSEVLVQQCEKLQLWDKLWRWVLVYILLK